MRSKSNTFFRSPTPLHVVPQSSRDRLLQTRLPYFSKDLRGHSLELITEAVVGGAAGHVAGHHGGAGAVAGCAIGHHQANKKDKAKDTQSNKGSDAAQSGSSQAAPANK